MAEIGVREAAAGLTGRRWLFGPAVLDERSLELFVKDQQVVLERKPLEVLLYLLHHAGEVVTKDDFAENLWPGRILTETVLARSISVLRQALQDDDRTLIRTVHGYGYRLVAQVKVEATEPVEPPTLDFEPGDSPPTRPHWRLVERLGTGGHGEAWLARHEKTGDARVFKFAVDANALTSLKREITLYRLLHDSLGARAAVARILEWNLEEPPYFIEEEYVASGSLQAWADAQGGLAGIPLALRLDLAAQVAEAVAAAHSVGALHKDLKPGNVLVDMSTGRPSIRLCDFGSGSVLDPTRLEALGITRLGFTKSTAHDSATPLYIAPEVIAGQPCTVQADIYALGIMLYQLVSGDLRKALAPGWEADVEDELLREDIAAAAAGNPERRLTDAAHLAERLRTLEQRRAARAAEAAARLRAERVRRIQEELRRTRAFAIALCLLAAVAVAGGITAYRARNEAVAATATAKAVSDFLMEDVLRTDSGLFRPSETSYESLLKRATQQIGTRLKDQPAAAVSMHTLLGRRYQELGAFDRALEQYDKAVALAVNLYGDSAEPALMAMDRLAWMYLESGRTEESQRLVDRLRATWQARLDPSDLSLLVVRTRLVRTALGTGAYEFAETELRAVINAVPAAGPATPLSMRLLGQWLGVTPSKENAPRILSAYAGLLLAANVLEETGDGHDEARAILEDSLSVFSETLGADAELTALAHLALSVVLSGTGEYDRAEAMATRARDSFDRGLPKDHYARGLSRMALGRLRIEQRRYPEAIKLLEESVDLCTDRNGCPPRLRFEFLWILGKAYAGNGNLKLATETLRSTLDLEQSVWGENRLFALAVRVSLADVLRQSGQLQEAMAVLPGDRDIARLTPYQQLRADLYRVRGLILFQQGAYGIAIHSLTEALEIFERRVGPKHWRSIQASAELAAAKGALEEQGPPESQYP